MKNKRQKAIDSMVIIGEEGSENITGKEDGLKSSTRYPGVVRFQALYKQ